MYSACTWLQILIVSTSSLPSSLSVLIFSDLSSGVLVHGSKSCNRAIHGDVVVVELLPRSEWRGQVTALCQGGGGQGEEKGGEEAHSKPMPTGKSLRR